MHPWKGGGCHRCGSRSFRIREGSDNYRSSPPFGRCQPLTARLRRVAWECLTQGSGNKVRGGVMPGLGIAI